MHLPGFWRGKREKGNVEMVVADAGEGLAALPLQPHPAERRRRVLLGREMRGVVGVFWVGGWVAAVRMGGRGFCWLGRLM